MARFVNAAMWAGKEIEKLEKAAAGSTRPEGALPLPEEMPGAPAPASVDESDVFVKGGDPEWDAEQRAAWAL